MAFYISYPTDDIYISEFFSTQNFVSSPFLYTGEYTEHNKCPDAYRSLLKFNTTDIIPSKSFIEKVTLHLYVNRKDKTDYKHSSQCLTVYSNLINFSENTATWNNAPNISITPYSKTILNKDIGNYIQLDITRLFLKWHDKIIANNGITLVGTENIIDTIIGYGSSRSSNSPYLSIKYTYNTECQQYTQI